MSRNRRPGASVASTVELNSREREVLEMVGERPVPVSKVMVTSAAQRAIASLKRKGLVQTASFTPSDAAHVLGLQSNWPGPAAVAGIQSTSAPAVWTVNDAL